MTTLVSRAVTRRRPIRLGDTAEQVTKYVVLLGLAAWIIANLVYSPSQFFQNIETGLGNGLLYAMIALGYTLVYGIIELINFAHGDLFMLSTVLAANMMVNWLGFTSPSVTAFLGMLLTMVVCMIFGALVNVGAEFLAYRRLRNAPKLAPLITAIGLSLVFSNVGLLVNGSGQKLWNTVFTQAGFSIGGVKVLWSFLVILGAVGVLLLGLTFIVQRTRQGKAMRATAQDQDAARLMGINVNRTISFTFALGGAMAGAGAVLYLETQGYTRYDAGLTLGLYAFTAAVLGGIGNLLGAVVGAIAIGIVEALNNGSHYSFGSQWTNAVVFAVLILVLVFKPEGLLGTRTTEKV